MNKPLEYANCGVDIDAANAFVDRIKHAVSTTKRPEVLAGLGGFGALFAADFSKYEQPILVSSTDGVGTKLLLLSGREHTVGQDLVAMCVNDLAALAAEPLFFLDYLACGSLDPERMANIVEGIAIACKVCGCAIIGGETAEMPGMYAEKHYDVAGFTVGVAERNRIVDGSKLQSGDVLLGLASSGPHSNGFSLIRKLIEMGNIQLDEEYLPDGTLLADAVLAPTRLYSPAVKALMAADATGDLLHALSHITGGGLYDNIERLLPSNGKLCAVIDANSWSTPAVFSYLLQAADIAARECYRTLNMGIGFVVMIAEKDATRTQKILEDAGEKVYRIGYITSTTNNDGTQKELVSINGIDECP
ncbi:MAG: phosphoribosylformylglycinamidine cyclo-ligase [Mariprofundales bacterium]